METRNCIICGSSFTPNKYSPRQQVCGETSCQRTRQLRSMKEWRANHPNYFKYDESKGADWLRMQRERSRSWRKNNPDKIRSYRQAHIDEYRQYMREYMRQYRNKKKGIPTPPDQAPQAGPIPSAPPPPPPPPPLPPPAESPEGNAP